MLKAALHVHSTYSDGEFTLAELKQLFSDVGCSLVGMTDHAQSFDRAKLADYVSECKSLSDDHFLFLCGIEFGCERQMHMLGYGTTALTQTQDPQKVIRHIEENRGLAVIAHPKDSMFPWIETFGVLPGGIETWNTKYDGRYAPRLGTFELVQRLRTKRRDLRAFYGQDLHWKNQFRGLFTELQCDSLDRDEILNALARGNYSGVKGDLQLASSGDLDPELATQFDVSRTRSDKMHNFLKAGKRALDQLGIVAPASIKAQLRRLF